MTKQTFVFNKIEIRDIAEFADKYPDAMCIEVAVETGSIGQVVTVSVDTVLHDDWVTITKTITDQKSW